MKKNFRLLRDDIYHDLMKPYFAAGQNFKDFRKVWLDEDQGIDGFPVGIDLALQNRKSFFEKYILINPKTSKVLFYWD